MTPDSKSTNLNRHYDRCNCVKEMRGQKFGKSNSFFIIYQRGHRCKLRYENFAEKKMVTWCYVKLIYISRVERLISNWAEIDSFQSDELIASWNVIKILGMSSNYFYKICLSLLKRLQKSIVEKHSSTII